MNGFEDLFKKYGTSLEETRKLVPQLTEAVRKRRKLALPTAPVFLTSDEAGEYGVKLDPGWMVKLTPGKEGAEPSFSFITPEKWEITEAQEYISPEGERFTREQLEAQLFAMPEYEFAPPEEGLPGYEAPPPPYEKIFGKVFPEREFGDVLAYAEADPEAFYGDIYKLGRTQETENLLLSIFPSISKVELEEFFAGIPSVEEESKIKDIWDAFYVGATQMWQHTKEYLLSTLPNMFFSTTGEMVKEMGFTPEIRAADERMLKQLRGIFRKQYLKEKNKYQEWVDAHPELKPRPEWEGSTLEMLKTNPATFKDPAYWGYVAADSAAFMLAFLGTTLAVSAATGNPLLGLAAGVAVTTPAQSQDLYDDLLNSGATEDQAALLAVPIGTVISSVEIVGAFPFLQAVSPAFSKILRKNIQREVVKQTIAHLVARGLWTFTKVEIAETLEEVVQGAIQNATVKTIDENRDILEGLDETTIRTLMAVAPFALLGGGVSMRRVPENEANRLTPEQKREQGWQQDEETGDWLKPTSILTEEALKELEAKVFMALPDSEKVISGIMVETWHRKLLKGLAKLPPIKTAIEWGLGKRILVGRQSEVIEDIVGRARFLHAEIARRGEGAQAYSYWRLFSTIPNDIEYFGFSKDIKANAFSRKMFKRLLAEHKDSPEGGTFEHIFTHPEMYNWKGIEKGLEYVTKVHKFNAQIRNMLVEEGVAEEIVGNDWWVHRVVYGKFDPNEELLKVRGKPGVKRGGVGAKASFEMHRKAPTMAEGIAWNIAYGRSASESISTYLEEAFKKIADERMVRYLAKELEPLAKMGVLPSEELLRKYPEVVERAILTAEELADSNSFVDKINRAIRGEKLPEQTLRAVERRFPELGRRFRALVGEPATAEKGLRQLIKDNEKLIRSLQRRLEKAKAVDIKAIKAQATAEARLAIPDEHKMAEAFRVMDLEDRLAFRSTMESQVDDVSRVIAEQETELRGIQEFLTTDPVASFTGQLGRRKVHLDYFIKKGEFPESFTLKEAAMLMQKRVENIQTRVIKGGVRTDRVPREVVLDGLADYFKMEEQQLIDHIEFVATQKTTAEDLRFLIGMADSRYKAIKRMLGILDNVDTTPANIPEPMEYVTPYEAPVPTEPAVGAGVIQYKPAGAGFKQKLTPELAFEQLDDMAREAQLTETRLARLKAKQKVQPEWKAYDRYADEVVGIDVRIEEQEAVLGMLKDDIATLEKAIETAGAIRPVARPPAELLPKAEAGMPEAGIQKDIFGYETPVFPKGKGEVTQIGMDDYTKLVELRKAEGLPPPDVVIKPKIEGVEGFEEVGVDWGKVTFGYNITKVKGLKEKIINIINQLPIAIKLELKAVGINAERAKEIGPMTKAAWIPQEKRILFRRVEDITPYTLSHELGHSLLDYAIEQNNVNLMRKWLEAIGERAGIDVDVISTVEIPRIGEDFAESFAKYVRRPQELTSARLSFFEEFYPKTQTAQIAEVTYEVPAIKGVKERRAELVTLREEVQALAETRRIPFWQARRERAFRMEQIRQPGIDEGYIRQPFAGGRKFDQELIDAFNKFFGHDAGLSALRVTADTAGILRILKAALDWSQSAIQGTLSWGLAHSYLMINPAKGVKLVGAWYYSFFLQIGAFFNPGITANFIEKHKDAIARRIAAGGSARAVYMFQEMQAAVGKGTLARWGEKGLAMIPLDPYHRAETSFFTGGEIVRDTFWEIFEADAIKRGGEAELARFLDILTGIGDPRAMGVPLTIRQIEQSFIFFSSAYTRSYLTLVAEISRGGMTGALARRALAGFVVAGVAYLTGVQYAISTLMGKDDDEAWEDVRGCFCIEKDPITGEWEWKPTAKFMSLKIGDTYFGIGGGIYGLMRLGGNVAATIAEIGERERIDLIRIMKHGSLNKRDNPWLAWWFPRASALFSPIYEMATHRDFLGYPIETPEEYARYIISRLEPIWVEQSLNPLIPGMAGNREKPEDALETALWITGEVFGLRVNPEYSWQGFYNKANEYIALMTEDKLEDWQKEAWRKGELKWKHLTPMQQTDLLSSHPELLELYEESQADSELRASPHWKAWEGRQKEEKTIYYERGTELWERFVTGEFDSRELREMWSEAGRNYGHGLDVIERDPAYKWVYDFFDRKRAKGVKYLEEAFFALAEYQKIMFADYTDAKGDIDWDAKDAAIDTFIERYGEEMYAIIREMYADEKLMAGLPLGLARLAEDKDKLGRSYWRLPYKPIYEMDQDDEAKGNIPAEYLSLWKAYSALEEGEKREQFLLDHPEVAKDWRAEYRKANPEDDARLALWGYGGKLQSREAFNLVEQWSRELGIPLEQMGLGLPPRSLIDDYFELNNIVALTGGSSWEAKIFKLEHPQYLAWGLEQGIWKDDLSDESMDALRLKIKLRGLTPETEEYRKVNYEIQAFENEIPLHLVETYIDWYMVKRKDYEDDWYLMEHPEFYQAMVDKELWQPRDFSKVPSREVHKLLENYLKIPAGKERLVYRHNHPELEDWLVKVKGYTPVGDRWENGKEDGKEKGEPKTPLEEKEEAERMKEFIQKF